MADKIKTSSGIEIPVTAAPHETDHPQPGDYPFTRGIYPEMYRGRFWTMRQYAGFGTAKETNERYRYLLKSGQTGLSVAFDLPTQIGYDSDDPLAQGEVGRTGVAIDTIDDMETVFDGIPLGEVSTSMTINATAIILLAMYVTVARRQGVSNDKIRGTIQNDILKEFIARGTYIYPPRPSMRLITDIFAYAGDNLPNFNTISISGYHIREAGATAVQEIAFTFANAIAYIEAAQGAGLEIDRFAPRLSFFFNVHNNIFEEIAKFRAARRIWAGIVKERFGAKDKKSMLLRFHTQTAGSTLTAQQPENNIIRVTLQALAAVLGGTQSLHTNSFDEALGLPTRKAAMIALRTQQIIAHESGAASSVDPLAGSYYVEYLTDELEKRILELLKEIDTRGGALKGIETSYFQNAIARSAYEYQKRVESGEDIEVGVNRFQVDDKSQPEILKVDKKLEEEQIKRLSEIKASRDQNKVAECLDNLAKAAQSTDNMVGPVTEAVASRVTIGEISNCLRQVWGTYESR
jgi:methylmalonyl-CoA mutase N-terminal domain/subunit